MPHKCTNCDEVIPNESDALLSGCPECENKSWEYVENKKSKTQEEDESQKAARTEFVDSENLPSSNIVEGLQSSSRLQNQEIKTVDNVSEVQEKLNNQYEGIKVVRNGKYKINLTELYRGNDYIIELDDNGAYTVKKASEI